MEAVEVQQEAPEKALTRKVETWPEKARALIVKDQETYEVAGACLKGIKDLRAEIEATFGPIIAKAFAAHKEAVAQRKRIEAPLEEAERILKSSASRYIEEQEQKRREEQRRLEEEDARKRAEEIEAQVQVAEARGATAREVAAIITQAEAAPITAVVAPPAVQRVEGISGRETWRGEVFDKAALIRAAATSLALHPLLVPDQGAINSMARALKGAFNIPGVRAVRETGISVRRN